MPGNSRHRRKKTQLKGQAPKPPATKVSIEDRIALELKRIEAARSLPRPRQRFRAEHAQACTTGHGSLGRRDGGGSELLYRWKVAGRPHPSSVSVTGMRGWSRVMNAFRACLRDSAQWVAEASQFEEIEMVADVFRSAVIREPHFLDEVTIRWTERALPGLLAVPEPYRRAMALVWAQGGIGESAEPGHFARVPDILRRCAESVGQHKQLPEALGEPIAQDLFRIAGRLRV